jgi:HAE1 family hydrophobic/amphiphilic exporter-1
MSAAMAQREAAEQQYISEQRKFQAGMSTVFLVLQRQTDLVTARGRELETQTDLNKALADFQRATGNTFNYRNVAVISQKGDAYVGLTNEEN